MKRYSGFAFKAAAFSLSFLFITAFAFLFFIFLRATVPADIDTSPATYLVRISAVEKDTLSHIQVGDLLTDSVTKEPLGVLLAISAKDTEKEAVKNGVLLQSADPHFADITLSISVPLTKDGVTAGGIRLRAGKTLHLRMPQYLGTGICLGVAQTDGNYTYTEGEAS